LYLRSAQYERGREKHIPIGSVSVVHYLALACTQRYAGDDAVEGSAHKAAPLVPAKMERVSEKIRVPGNAIGADSATN
jgi:hypothetical protein